METVARTKKQLYISLGFMLLSCVVYAGFAWHLHVLERMLDDTLRTIKEQQSINEQFNTLSDIVNRTTDERAILQKAIVVGEAGVVEILSEIDLLAAQLEVELETSALTVTGETDAPFKQLNLTVTATGARASVEEFVTALESLPYAKQITALRIADLVASRGTTASTIGLKVSMQ